MTDLADILYQANHLRQILFSELVANDFFLLKIYCRVSGLFSTLLLRQVFVVDAVRHDHEALFCLTSAFVFAKCCPNV